MLLVPSSMSLAFIPPAHAALISTLLSAMASSLELLPHQSIPSPNTASLFSFPVSGFCSFSYWISWFSFQPIPPSYSSPSRWQLCLRAYCPVPKVWCYLPFWVHCHFLQISDKNVKHDSSQALCGALQPECPHCAVTCLQFEHNPLATTSWAQPSKQFLYPSGFLPQIIIACLE